MPHSAPVFFRILGVSAFCLCGQSIAFSSNPVLFAAFVIATVGVFVLCRGNAAPVFVIAASGPIVNMAALYYDPYVYNVEIVLLTYLGCFFLKNREYTVKNAGSMPVSYVVMLIMILISAFVHVVFQGNKVCDEIRLVRGFLIGGFLLAFLVTEGKPRLLLYYKSILIAALLISTNGLVEFLIRGISAHTWGQEPRSVFSGSEPLAVFLCTIVPLILTGKSLFTKRVWPLLADSTAVCATALLLATRSRTGILSLLLFLFFYSIHIIKNKSPKKAGIIIATAGVTSAALITVALKTFGTGYHVFNNPIGRLFSSRIDAWSEGIKSFATSPLWGNGPGSNAYNLYIQLLHQFGIAGFATFLFFLFFAFVQYCRSRTESRAPLHDGIFWSVIALLIAGFGESAIGNQFGYFVLFLLLLLGTTGSSMQKNQALLQN